jgi:secreted Zn-dependent insulinase-like peptidase
LEGELPFAIPEPNPFLASDFSLFEPSSIAASISVPTKIHCTEEGFSLWYRPDSKFRIPKAVLNFYLVTPLSTDCARKYEMIKTNILLYINLLLLNL